MSHRYDKQQPITMEVRNQGESNKPGTLDQGSDDVSTHQCEQCKDDGISVDATGFCTECKDYLCNSCIQQHSKLRGLKDHKVLTGHDVPHQKPQKTEGDQCPQHPTETIKLYCEAENSFGCIRCFTEGHTSCLNGLIADLCKDIESSEELEDIQLTSEWQKKRVNLYRKVIQEYHLINNKCHDQSLKDFSIFRTDIEKKLHDLGKAVSAKAGRQKDENKKKLDELSDTVTDLDQEMVSLISEIELHQKTKKLDRLFISVKKNRKKIKEKEEKLRELHTSIHIESYRFTEVLAIKDMLDKMTSTDAVEVLSGDMSCLGKINVKAPEDTVDCNISGMVEISPSMLVVADHDNVCLKTIDVSNNTITGRRPLSSHPYDVTDIPGSRVAVTMAEEEEIQIFSTDNLDPCGTVAVDGECWAVKSRGAQLLVMFNNPVKLEMMDLQGQLLKSIVPATLGDTLFGGPGYVSLSSDHSSIYVSDIHRNMVTCLDIDGTVVWEYDDDELISPLGVVARTSTCLYICSRDTGYVHVVSPTGVRLRPISLTQFQLENPCALCINHDHNILYVSSEELTRNYISQLYLQ